MDPGEGYKARLVGRGLAGWSGRALVLLLVVAFATPSSVTALGEPRAREEAALAAEPVAAPPGQDPEDEFAGAPPMAVPAARPAPSMPAGSIFDPHVTFFDPQPNYINVRMTTKVNLTIGSSYGANLDNYSVTVTAPGGSSASVWYNFTAAGYKTKTYGNSSIDFMVLVSAAGTYNLKAEHWDGSAFSLAATSTLLVTSQLTLFMDFIVTKNPVTGQTCSIVNQFIRGARAMPRAYVYYASNGLVVSPTTAPSAVGNITDTFLGRTQVLRWSASGLWREGFLVDWNTSTGIKVATIQASDGRGNTGTLSSPSSGSRALTLLPAPFLMSMKLLNSAGGDAIYFQRGETIKFDVNAAYSDYGNNNPAFRGPLNATRGGGVLVHIGYGGYNSSSGKYNTVVTQFNLTHNYTTKTWQGSYSLPNNASLRQDYGVLAKASDAAIPANTGSVFGPGFTVAAPALVAPTVVAPADGAKVNGTATVAGSASPLTTLVEVRVGAGAWQSATGTSTWSYPWDTTGVADGIYALRSRAFDGTSYSPETVIAVMVWNAPPPDPAPTVAMTSPADGSKVKGTIEINGTASADATLVEVKIGADPWKNATGTASWKYTWDTTTVPDFVYTVRSRAFDGTSYSAEQSGSVLVWNAPPPPPPPPDAPVIAGPAEGAMVNGTVTVQGTADPMVHEVEVKIGSGAWEHAIGKSSWTYSWDTKKAADGAYGIRARAHTMSGYTNESSVGVMVWNAVAPPPPPAVAISAPADQTKVNGTVTVKGTASATATKVEIKIGAGSWTTVTGTTTWTYDWNTKTVPDGAYTIRVRSHDGTSYSTEEVISAMVWNAPPVQPPPAEVKGMDTTLAVGLALLLLVVGIGVGVMVGKMGKRGGPSREEEGEEEREPEPVKEKT